MDENLFQELLFRVAQDVSALAPDKIWDRDVMQILQKHFYPYDRKPSDEFSSWIKPIYFRR